MTRRLRHTTCTNNAFYGERAARLICPASTGVYIKVNPIAIFEMPLGRVDAWTGVRLIIAESMSNFKST
jgi:hypothetical protein